MLATTIFALLLAFLGIVITSYLCGSILFGALLAKLQKVNLRAVGSGNIGATNSLRVFGPVKGFLVMVLDFFKAWLSVFLASFIYDRILVAFGVSENVIDMFAFTIYFGGLFAVIGHIFPITWIITYFKNHRNYALAKKAMGGKGVSTAAGFVAAISPIMFFVIFITFWSLLFITKYVSLSSLLTTALLPLLPLIPAINYLYLLTLINTALFHNLPAFDNFYEVENTINYVRFWWYIGILTVLLTVVAALIFFRHQDNIIRLLNGQEKHIFQRKNKKAAVNKPAALVASK